MSLNSAIIKERTGPFSSSWIQTVRQEGKDFALFIKMKLSLLVLFSVLIGFWLTSGGAFSSALFFKLALGSFFLIAGANAFNEIWERNEDRFMRRTSIRPLPSGRMEIKKAWEIAAVLSLSGIFLLSRVHFLVAFLAGIAFLSYLFAYTPLKKKSPWCVLVGAVAGAIPALMGAAAMQNAITGTGLLLFAVVFFWQFPHFFAIASVAKEDYERAGFKMLAFPENPKFTAYAILFSSLLLCCVSFALAVRSQAGLYPVWGSIFLGLFLLAFAFCFLLRPTLPYARRMMGAALLYLPLLYICLIFDRIPLPRILGQ